jgi:protein associated with RNAse G/E
VSYRDSTGRSLHDASIDQLVDASHVHGSFQRYSTLMSHPVGANYSVWWLFADERFAGWYVNLEAPFERHAAGIDTTDHALDLEVDPDRGVSWKDEAEFVARAGHPWYWDATEAATIRATAERVAALAAEGAYPFDGTHCDFRPEPAWSMPELPDGWDQPPSTS